MARLHIASPSTLNLTLGFLGILGGSVLLAPFVVDIDPEVNAFRIILFNVGVIAVVIAVHQRQAPSAPRLALAASVAAVAANGWHLAMTVLASGRDHPFAGDFGLVYFFAAIAMWLTDATFGLVTLRLGVVSRWGALALGVGSLLAITGIDRLGLTSADNLTIFHPIALTGLALNGIGWILLGLAIAMSSRDDSPGGSWA